jgi:hypothetical protein
MQAQFPMEGTQGFADPSFSFSMQQPGWLKGQSSIQNLIAARSQQPATIASPNSPPAGVHNPNSPTMHALNAISGMNPMEQNQTNMARASSPSHAFNGKFNFAQAEIHSDESDEVDESSGEKALANRDDISDDGKKQLSLPTKNGENGTRYLDITEHLNLPQAEAAKKLGIPTSTLSKRWKEAVRNRKWPYRAICKLDKEIMTLLHNIPQGPDAAPLPEDIETTLGYLLRKRQEELKPVVIRL